ncbi:hypothetical protein KZZ52_52515 [Dactylosporangium sp. AC04546]|uniref:hypothetical protein n=1 Tax=Dactylosporangium sp. AC04546 TaxID=2862460 RepID=UPI001EDDBE7E|nr:hypothetical protein [Dactylosporangium sp. AC04546]WVK82486.1 hypothetical protein KZZ52_52515 [Dactylosporangium sp. AC04546]
MLRSRKVIVGGVVLLVLGGVTGLAVFLYGLGSERADRWASAGSLLVGITGLAVSTVGTWAAIRQPAGGGDKRRPLLRGAWIMPLRGDVNIAENMRIDKRDQV